MAIPEAQQASRAHLREFFRHARHTALETMIATVLTDTLLDLSTLYAANAQRRRHACCR